MFLADASAAAKALLADFWPSSTWVIAVPRSARVSLELCAQGSCPPDGVLELLDERRDTGVCLFKCRQERQTHRGVVELLVERYNRWTALAHSRKFHAAASPAGSVFGTVHTSPPSGTAGWSLGLLKGIANVPQSLKWSAASVGKSHCPVSTMANCPATS